MAIKIILIREDKTGWDITDIVTKITWSGRRESPARSLKLEILDDPDLGENNRPKIDVYQGNHVIMLEDGNELFRGIFMRQSRNEQRKLTVDAYDNAIYLSNNQDAYKYKKKTAQQIFLDLCNRYEIPRGEATPTVYKIKNLVQTNATPFDILSDALSQTYKATGERYYVQSKKGLLNLIQRRQNKVQLVVETGSNITNYTYTKDISKTRTRLKLFSDKGKVKAKVQDDELEQRIGMMQAVMTPDQNLKKKQLKSLAESLLQQYIQPQETLSVKVLGASDVISGVCVYFSVPEIGIEKSYYVDADTHTWDAGFHSMQLTLNGGILEEAD